MEWLQQFRMAGDRAVRLKDDLEYFCAEVLRIRPKVPGLAPLVFNAAQRELHRRLEAQKARTGKVRAIVLKARQMGVSTYVAARFYHQTIQCEGLRTAIIAHERPAVRNLFDLVKRFHEHMPADLRPSTGASNSEELIFDKIDSGYLVSVATEQGAGRSSTAQLLHASEAAFWVDLHEQMSALLQTIPDGDGTEIILETTGKEFGDDFHQLFRRAEAGDGEFEVIFLPWSIEPGYRSKLPESFEMTGEERQLAEQHGLDEEQICWRRNKISQMQSEDKFKREYPMTAGEAFMASSFDSFITSDLVMHARKINDVEAYGPLVIGCDPAGMGADSTAIAWRRGHCIERIEKRRGLNTMEVAGWISQILREDSPAQVNIDVGGLGVGVFDRLVEQGHGEIVTPVNFGGKPVEPAPLDEAGKPGGGPANRRSEMWSNLKDALQEGRFRVAGFGQPARRPL